MRWARFGTLVLLSAGALPGSTVAQQCPDGSMAVGGRCGKAPAAPPLQADRLAIVPFRTSGADPALSHLREGLVELLSAYFNGAMGTSAVESGEVLAAWRRAGIGPEPATQAAAVRVARQLGAGQVAYGTVVGTARRFTVTTFILRVSTGTPTGPPVQIEGTADSLAAVVRALATKLLGQREGAFQTCDCDAGTSNDQAALAYITGMAAYRTRRESDALQQFRRAIALDSSFTLAAFRLAILYATILGPSGGIREAAVWPKLWAQRARLTGEHRQLLEAVAVGNGLLSRMAALRKLERAVAVLPNSVEAWDLHGDQLFHVGALVGKEDWMPRAKAAFLRALALDSSLAVGARQHLTDLAFAEGDAKELARYGRAAPGPRVAYQAALLGRDPGAIRAARVEYAREVALYQPYLTMLTGLPWPPRELDSLLIMLDSTATSTELRNRLDWSAAHAFANLGRPSLAQAALRRFFKGDSNPNVPAFTLYFAEEDSATAETFSKVWDRPDTSLRGQVLGSACQVALSKLRRRDTSRVAEILSRVRPEGGPSLAEFFPTGALPVGDRTKAREAICAEVLRGALAAVNHTDAAPLVRADSLMRAMPLVCCDYWNYDLGLAFARYGQYAMAAAASRRHWIQQSEPAPRLAVALLGEGRWSALAGDTVAAIKAYQQYLAWRENPEPVLVPQRDSARAEFAALEKARRRPKPRPGGR